MDDTTKTQNENTDKAFDKFDEALASAQGSIDEFLDMNITFVDKNRQG